MANLSHDASRVIRMVAVQCRPVFQGGTPVGKSDAMAQKEAKQNDVSGTASHPPHQKKSNKRRRKGERWRGEPDVENIKEWTQRKNGKKSVPKSRGNRGGSHVNKKHRRVKKEKMGSGNEGRRTPHCLLEDEQSPREREVPSIGPEGQ